MNDTERLIEQLADRSGPVKRLSSPLRRTLSWLLMAVPVMLVIVAAHGPRVDWWRTMAVPSIAVEWMASLLTGILAAYAAFQVSVPGRSTSWAWLPLPAALLWLAGLGMGCMGDFLGRGFAAFTFQLHAFECAWAIALTSLPLGFVLLWMVRHAGVVRPAPTAILAALSAAALSAATVSLIHEGETALMVLLWHVGMVIALSMLSWWFSGRFFSWIGYARK
ncbi:NrsF family protein [Lysobacter sp. CA196]|uniref:NrsF family protein n=1 Tax=Lysobacter sp. CA196 TaxID=3455606 RepID=UPI003F8CF480